MEYGIIFTWWILMLVLSILGLPIVTFILSRLPDKGVSVSLPFSLSILFFVVYWAGHLSFGLSTAILGISVLSLISLIIFITKKPKIPYHSFIEVFLVFTIAFIFIVFIRSIDPSIYSIGGEKFLDFGLLQSILRTSILPPEDMWFAGEQVRYYYGGHLITATLSLLSGISAKFAYNLALASFFGALVSSVYGLSGSISILHGQSQRLAGFLGALIVGISSNFVVPFSIFLWILPFNISNKLSTFVSGVTDISSSYILSPNSFFYWTSSRVIRGTINEFPFFAWLNGDLHAHMMSTPFMVLILSVLLAYSLSPSKNILERRLLILGVLPFLSGMIAVINTWSYPTVFGITFLTLLLSKENPLSLIPFSNSFQTKLTPFKKELFIVLISLIASSIVLLVGSITVAPFFAHSASLHTISFLPTRSGLTEFLLVYLFFISIFAIYLFTIASMESKNSSRIMLISLLIFIAGILFNFPVISILLPLCLMSYILLKYFSSKVNFELILFLAGSFLIILTEILFIQEQAGPGRMNTVFKIYMQVWIFFSIGVSISIVRLTNGDLLKNISEKTRLPKKAIILIVSLLILSTTVYSGFSISEQASINPQSTLDATTYAQVTHPAEWESILFLQTLSGSPNMVTVPGCWCNHVKTTRPYSWINAPSSFTGIPTVAGWSHEVGYRGGDIYSKRVGDVYQIYTGSSETRKNLLLYYDVKYVYLGPNEKILYGVSILDDAYLKIIFQNEEIIIYEFFG